MININLIKNAKINNSKCFFLVPFIDLLHNKKSRDFAKDALFFLFDYLSFICIKNILFVFN